MAYETLEITLTSAQDIKNVNLLSRLAVYAVTWLSSDPASRHRTSPDLAGRCNPIWNATFRFHIPHAAAAAAPVLHVLLRARRSLGDRDVGEVHVPLQELLSAADPDSPRSITYQVRRPSSGRAKGVLNLSYKLTDPIPDPSPNPYSPPNPKSHPEPKPDEPITAYPAAAYPAPSPYGGYSDYPPPGAYGYAPQPGPSGYPYAAPAYGYGATGQVTPMTAAAPVPAKTGMGSKLGFGLGAGLIGGALGGFLVGDLLSDAAAYSSGYGAGFEDGYDY